MIFRYNGESRIFIHIPKTGGNTIQTAFIKHGITQDVQITPMSNQDGIHRFDIAGPITKRKHQSLSSYIKLNPELQSLRVLTAVRKPFERLISFYFAPFNHAFFDPATQKIRLPDTANFDESRFLEMAQRIKTAAELLSVDQKSIKLPQNLTIIKTETLNSQFEQLFPNINLGQRLNTSPYRDEARKITQSKLLKRHILNSKHAIDYKLFY